QASNNVGYLCMVEGNYEQAEQYFMEAMRSSPSFNEVAFNNLEKVRALAARSYDGASADKSTEKVGVLLECR
ncbi:MAG: tetratricopeptide repeat protein, partial [Gammaproteobacteria bacterium]